VAALGVTVVDDELAAVEGAFLSAMLLAGTDPASGRNGYVVVEFGALSRLRGFGALNDYALFQLVESGLPGRPDLVFFSAATNPPSRTLLPSPLDEEITVQVGSGPSARRWPATASPEISATARPFASSSCWRIHS